MYNNLQSVEDMASRFHYDIRSSKIWVRFHCSQCVAAIFVVLLLFFGYVPAGDAGLPVYNLLVLGQHKHKKRQSSIRLWHGDNISGKYIKLYLRFYTSCWDIPVIFSCRVNWIMFGGFPFFMGAGGV